MPSQTLPTPPQSPQSKAQVPGTPQRQTKKEANHSRRQQPGPLLSAISDVNQPEHRRQEHRRRPKPNRTRQAKLRIPAQQKFLKEAHQQKHHRPKKAKPKNASPMHRQMSYVKNSQAIHQSQQQRNARESPDRAHPE